MIKPIESLYNKISAPVRRGAAIAALAGASLLPMYGCASDKAVGPIQDCSSKQQCPAAPKPAEFYHTCVDENIEFKLGGTAAGVDSMKVIRTANNTCAYIAFGAEPFGQQLEFQIADIYGPDAAKFSHLKGQPFMIEFFAYQQPKASNLQATFLKRDPVDPNFFNALEYHFAPADGVSMQNPLTVAYAARNGVFGATLSVPGGSANTFNSADGVLMFDTSKGTTCPYYFDTTTDHKAGVDLAACDAKLGFTPKTTYIAKH